MVEHETGEAFDRDAVHAKYLEERDKRLVAGRAAIRDLTQDEAFARYRRDPFTVVEPRDAVADDVDVVIVGGGIAGITVGAHLRAAGVTRIRVIDEAGGFGGTWYWNRYPGVMCDIESYIYLPMLEEMGYVPAQRYASGEEIRTYLESIAQRYDLGTDALFHTTVTRAGWDDAALRWRITTDRGDELTARYYVLAVGILNLMKLPAIPGMEDFRGASFHTARWDYSYTGGGPGRALTRLDDKAVALIGTGATGIQCLGPLAEAARHVYVFQRTPSAIGVRGNRPTEPTFAERLRPRWQRDRMDNFQSIMLGRPVEEDLTDDGWTHHYAAIANLPERRTMRPVDFALRAEEVDFEIMEQHRRRVAETVEDPALAERLKPYYRYLCKRPCFHDEYLEAFNRTNVTLVDCPSGIDRVTAEGIVVAGEQYHVDCIVYGTGFEPEVTPVHRRAGHEVIGRDGRSLAAKWADGAASLFGIMTRGFPNMFIMPAPGQQAVVTVNYTQLAMLGAEFVSRAIRLLETKGVVVFDVAADAEAAWTQGIADSYIDGSRILSACTPSRINNEGDPGAVNPRNGNFGGGLGDYFAYRELLEGWLDAAAFDGLEVRAESVRR